MYVSPELEHAEKGTRYTKDLLWTSVARSICLRLLSR